MNKLIVFIIIAIVVFTAYAGSEEKELTTSTEGHLLENSTLMMDSAFLGNLRNAMQEIGIDLSESSDINPMVRNKM